MIKSRLSRYLIVCLFPQFCDRMLGLGQHRQSQLCALGLGRSHAADLSSVLSEYLEHDLLITLRLIRMSPI